MKFQSNVYLGNIGRLLFIDGHVLQLRSDTAATVDGDNLCLYDILGRM